MLKSPRPMRAPTGLVYYCSCYLVFKLSSPVRYGIRLNYIIYIVPFFPIVKSKRKLFLSHQPSFASAASITTTIVPRATELRQWNGANASCFLAADAARSW